MIFFLQLLTVSSFKMRLTHIILLSDDALTALLNKVGAQLYDEQAENDPEPRQSGSSQSHHLTNATTSSSNTSEADDKERVPVVKSSLQASSGSAADPVVDRHVCRKCG